MNPADIDFSELMDLRVDYAFKLLFGTGETRHLVSLLNAIFENKRIPRVVTSLTIVNPSLERADAEDKLSVLDVRAALADGSSAIIEMHLYDLEEHKYKAVRSLARAYGEDLAIGDGYAAQHSVVHISFTNGPVSDAMGRPVGKIHALFMMMERDSHEPLLSEMEAHFIDMRAFAKYCNEYAEDGDGVSEKFMRWLMLITEKEIRDKDAVRKICEEGEIMDAVETLTQLSMDKARRQAYKRRQDQIYFHNRAKAKNDAALADKDKIIANMDAELADKDAALVETKEALADKDAALADKDAALADKDAELAETKEALADKDAKIAELLAQLEKSK